MRKIHCCSFCTYSERVLRCGSTLHRGGNYNPKKVVPGDDVRNSPAIRKLTESIYLRSNRDSLSCGCSDKRLAHDFGCTAAHDWRAILMATRAASPESPEATRATAAQSFFHAEQQSFE